ncbi:hypothetical protein PYCCODRAFT_914457 [Trametes coccinea BRFM310]|uniref:Uncharacterized protein n=1 Tax=Trametes coccinea (strain BRFM310) TaxID=1353009 RepID=A0A1Y2IEK3_TRAC3|nr:hypothetical protein PYCCODRAFT_914457 [Trametes coccinea BRFM310]
MRTRRRPVLQDKTPINTPQKTRVTRASAKPDLVPVVELKARLRRASKEKSQDDESEQGAGVDKVAVDLQAKVAAQTGRAARETSVLETSKPARPVARAKRGRGRKALVSSRKEHRAPSQPPAPSKQHVEAAVQTSEPDVDARLPSPQAPPSPPETRDAPGPSSVNADNIAPVKAVGDIPLRQLSYPESPSKGRKPLVTRKRVPLAATAPPAPQRFSTPDTVPIAEEGSSPSDAVEAIFDTPSPARIARLPIPAQSTPLGGRLEQHFSPLATLRKRGRDVSSVQRWNNNVSRAYSPLPPSSPPPGSPPTQEFVAGSSRHQQQVYEEYDHDIDMAMASDHHAGHFYAPNDDLSSDDPFGLLAAERKVKAMREHHVAATSSKAAGKARAPLGTLAAEDLPHSDVYIPEHLPTPLPSDDSHNIDDLYLDVDPERPGPSRIHRQYQEEDENEMMWEEDGDEDKEDMPTPSEEDKENAQSPHRAQGHLDERSPSLDLPLEDDSAFAENAPLHLLPDDGGDVSIPPILAASANEGIEDIEEILHPSSSSASPTHALRTPHKHRSAHKRTPLPTPDFSDNGFSDSPLTARSAGRRDSSPSPVKPLHLTRPRPGPSGTRQPFAPIEVEPEQSSPRPAKVAGRKRTRAQAARSEGTGTETDPRAAVRELESLLPKRSKARSGPSTSRGAGRGRGRGRGRGAATGKGKARADHVEDESESGSESEEEDADTSPPKAKKAKTARGTGATRGRGTGRGRAQGKSAAPSSKRGRSDSKGKGKERADEEVDPDDDEERARKRQERLEYFRKLQEYSIEKEDVYVI